MYLGATDSTRMPRERPDLVLVITVKETSEPIFIDLHHLAEIQFAVAGPGVSF